MRDQLVITGVGCISSLGTGGDAFADALLAGRSGIATVTAFSTAGCRSHAAALLSGFDASRYLEPMKLRKIDEVGRLAIATCQLATADARLPGRSAAVGMAMGTVTGGLHSTVAHLSRLMTDGPASVPALGFSNTIGNAAASLCAIEFGLHGPNVTVAQKQASGLAAVVFAVTGLRLGRAQAYVCGGVDDIEEQFFRVHDRLGVLSSGKDGDEVSRPFDAGRNGFVLGTGGHLLVLETAASAERRGAPAYGEVLGVGAASSECRLNAWPAESHGMERAMRLAIEQGGMTPDDVSVVFASANSTRDLDRVEAQAIRRVFGLRDVPVVSIKGALGEFGSVGSASLTAALLCLRRGMVPPTLGLRQLDPDCPVNVSPNARATGGRVALVNATADGGAHFSVLIRACAGGTVEHPSDLR